MSIKSLLNARVKYTIITVIFSTVLFLLLSITILYMDRVALSHSSPMFSSIALYYRENIVLSILRVLILDFSTITKYVAELSVVLLIAQLIYKLIQRSKSAKPVN